MEDQTGRLYTRYDNGLPQRISALDQYSEESTCTKLPRSSKNPLSRCFSK